MHTPQPDPVGGRGGRGGASSGESGSAGARAGGAGGRASPGDAGPSGAGGSTSNAGTGSDEPDAGTIIAPPARDYCDAVSRVFTPTCGNGSCHTNRGATIGDFGAGPEQAAAYVGRGSVRDADCGLIIDPVEPQDSLILTKVTGDYPSQPDCGGRMPVGSFEVTDAQIDCISDWVEQFRD